MQAKAWKATKRGEILATERLQSCLRLFLSLFCPSFIRFLAGSWPMYVNNMHGADEHSPGYNKEVHLCAHTVFCSFGTAFDITTKKPANCRKCHSAATHRALCDTKTLYESCEAGEAIVAVRRGRKPASSKSCQKRQKEVCTQHAQMTYRSTLVSIRHCLPLQHLSCPPICPSALLLSTVRPGGPYPAETPDRHDAITAPALGGPCARDATPAAGSASGSVLTGE